MHHEKISKILSHSHEIQKKRIKPNSQIKSFTLSHMFIKLLILQVWLFQITQNSSGERNGLSITFNSYNSSFMGCV